MTARSWFVTGGTSGIGRALVDAALANGERATFTGRNASAPPGPNARGLPLDLANPAAVAAMAPHLADIDVLVNCAGQGLLGAIEEASEVEIARLFEINFFAGLRLIRAVLPYMRARQSGWIVNIGSIAARKGPAGSGLYAATKAALRAMSDALAEEVRPFGIRVMVVEPGAFRTAIAGSGRVEAAQRLPIYDATSGKRRDGVRAIDGNQAGDPVRAADAIRLAMDAATPPACLVLGAQAYARAIAAAHETLDELRHWESVSRSADFPSGVD
jgi:NAD(P)-dependent dehydrogenase (short-subunit alcohol dehydrogenase family)